MFNKLNKSEMENTTTKTTWKVDNAHSEIVFKVRHMMMTNVKGEFLDFDASILTDGNDFSTGAVNVSIDASSINTNNADRDGHLKSGDFFDAEKHEKISFVSTSMKKKNEEEFTLTGDLTIKGVTKSIDLDVEFGGILKDPWGNDRAGFSINGSLNRKDFGLNWNAALEAGGVLVGENVKINAEVQFVKA